MFSDGPFLPFDDRVFSGDYIERIPHHMDDLDRDSDQFRELFACMYAAINCPGASL